MDSISDLYLQSVAGARRSRGSGARRRRGTGRHGAGGTEEQGHGGRAVGQDALVAAPARESGTASRRQPESGGGSRSRGRRHGVEGVAD